MIRNSKYIFENMVKHPVTTLAPITNIENISRTTTVRMIESKQVLTAQLIIKSEETRNCVTH